MGTTEMSVEKQIKPWKVNDWMRNKIMQFKNAELYKKVLEKKTH